MNITQKIGVRLLAGLTTAGLLALPLLGSSLSAPKGRKSISLRHVESSAHPESLDSPLAGEVRRALAVKGPRANDSSSAAEAVRTSLEARYGEQLSEDEEDLAYVWIWNPLTEQWERVCTSVSTFRVDFGAAGTVEVRTSDDMALR